MPAASCSARAKARCGWPLKWPLAIQGGTDRSPDEGRACGRHTKAHSPHRPSRCPSERPLGASRHRVGHAAHPNLSPKLGHLSKMHSVPQKESVDLIWAARAEGGAVGEAALFPARACQMHRVFTGTELSFKRRTSDDTLLVSTEWESTLTEGQRQSFLPFCSVDFKAAPPHALSRKKVLLCDQDNQVTALSSLLWSGESQQTSAINFQ